MASLKRVSWQVHPSAYLLAAQLLMLVLFAIFDGLHSQRVLISVTGIAVLVLRIWVVQNSPASNWIAWLLAVPAFLLALLSIFVQDPWLLAVSALFDAALYFYAAASLIAYMMSDFEVTTDELFAAGATFTLLAWGYGYLYMALQAVLPGSFTVGARSSDTLTFIEALFLSFTNFTATGFGDIVPMNSWARLIIMLEQFTGIGYVAVVVSRLVGLTLQIQAKKKK